MVGSAALTPGAGVRAASGSATKPFFMEESLGHNETGRQLRKLRPVCEAGASESGRLDQRCLSQRSEEHTSELQSLMRISYAVFCLKKKKRNNNKRSKNMKTNTSTQTTQTTGVEKQSHDKTY